VLGKALHQGFLVENRVGADGVLAIEACVRAAADGYTLCTAPNNVITINPAIRAKVPYDSIRDLVPIFHYGYMEAAILVHPSVPVGTLRELFELAKAKPNALTWGAYGLGSPSHFYIEWLRNAKGISFYNVPYKAASLAFPAMLAGEVQIAIFAVGPAAQQVKNGKAKALAITTAKRSAHMPNVPTYTEAGLEIDIGTIWVGLFGPTGVPKDIVNRLNAELAKGLVNDPANREKFLTTQGFVVDTPAGGSPEEFAAMLPVERARFANIAKVSKITMQ
jgi:tripartite-type tricarboxylate transporter receptor subunit TctC